MMSLLVGLLVVVVVGATAATTTAATPPSAVRVAEVAEGLVLENGFLRITVNTAAFAVTIEADFYGQGSYTPVSPSPVNQERHRNGTGERDHLAAGTSSAFAFTRYDKTDGAVTALGQPLRAFQVVTNTTDKVIVSLTMVDSTTAPTALQNLTLTLVRDQRTVKASVQGKILSTAPTATTLAYVNAWNFNAISIYGLFEQGVVQMRNLDNGHFSASSNPTRVYGIGTDPTSNQPSSYDISFESGESSHVVLSTRGDYNSQSALQFVLAGSYPGHADQWDQTGWKSISIAARKQPPASNALGVPHVVPGIGTVHNFTTTYRALFGSEEERLSTRKGTKLECSVRQQGRAACLQSGASWGNTIDLTLTNRNFPAGGLSTAPAQNLPPKDLEAFLTGAYGSSPGCLCTYPNEVKEGVQVAQIATTIARPDRGYANTYNYFDPDNFISLSALIYSGDPFLQEQARLVIERSGAFLKPNGQLPHHFVYDQPTYVALSGATQTGPNTFWTMAGLQYAKATGNMTWLASYMPTLRKAANFCFNLIDTENYLLDAPGSLMIDVFIRQNFTSDSNAMIAGFLREFAFAEEAVGNNTGASHLRFLSAKITQAVNNRLWAADGIGRGGDDHYITQLNPDNTTRDFVDYDSNLIAIAHGIPSPAQAQRILNRIDSGMCADSKGGGPEFVSEVYYGPTDTVNGNIGDSFTAMGRIAWFESHARKRVGDQKTFDDAILAPLQTDLIANTWLHERYQCKGGQMLNRTEAYFEYPATVAMLLREIRYGVNLGLRNITVDPFGPTEFVYDIGNVFVNFTQTAVAFSVPGQMPRFVKVASLLPNRQYSISAAAAPQHHQSRHAEVPQPRADACDMAARTLVSSDAGILSFDGAPTIDGCHITIVLQQA